MRGGRANRRGWGGLPRPAAHWRRPSGEAEARSLLRTPGPALTLRGLGRSYGDAATGDSLVETSGLRGRFDLDAATGRLRASAGWGLGEVLARTLPAGWAPAVLPGTRHVTLGGAVAADVHGKNHHVDGAFCRHVLGLRVALADGAVVECDRAREPELFRACCGGMGLAGLVLEVEMRLARRRGGSFRRLTVACTDLDKALAALSGSQASHTVAWVDAASGGSELGRCLVYLGDPADDGPVRPAPGARLAVPLRPPVNLVRPALVRAFNAAVWGAGRRRHGREDLQPHGDFFWPLDAVAAWNRLYGSRGFLQFQCLLPAEELAQRGAALLHRLLELFHGAGGGCLAVLKTMGARDEDTSPIAFPGPGATLALDLPAGAAQVEAVQRAHHWVADWGGRVYLAKDALLTPAEFAAMTPGLGEWRRLRERWDPGRRLTSDLAERLEL